MHDQPLEYESLMSRLARNFGRLARGRGVAAVLELLAVAKIIRLAALQCEDTQT